MKKKNEMYHHGIKGQRWGIRRYQNRDGTLTPLGKRRYMDKEIDRVERQADEWSKLVKNGSDVASKNEYVNRRLSEVMRTLDLTNKNTIKEIDDMIDKYSRKIIESYSDDNLKKQNTPKSASDSSANFTPEMKQQSDKIASNFKVDKWNDYVSTTKHNVGYSKNVEVTVNSSYGHEKEAGDTATRCINNFNISKARNAIANEYYDTEYLRSEWGINCTRKEFKNKINIVSMDIDTNHKMYTAVYDDGGSYQGHVFVSEGSIPDMKIKRISLEG